MRSSLPTTYVERVNRAIDFVVTRLGQPGSSRGPKQLQLNEVARAAGLSPFHFHRIFQALNGGETLADFVRRARLEKALSLLADPSPRKKPSLTSIALACGFSSSSDFSRSFKQRYGAAPSRFDINAWREAHRAEIDAAILHSPFLPRTTATSTARHLHVKPATSTHAPVDDNPDGFKARIRDLPARTVAYIRVANPFDGDAVVKANQRLMAWAERHNHPSPLADGQWLGYLSGKPEIVGLKHCIYHAAVEVPASRLPPRGTLKLTGAGGEIGLFRFPAMTVAQVEVRGDIHLETRAIRWLYGSWLPTSIYIPDDHPAFEAWIGRPFAHGMEHFELYAQLPVRRA